MNIAFFTDAYYPRINGVAVSVRSYATKLAEMGHSVCIVCCNYDDEEDKKDKKKKRSFLEDDKLHPNLKIYRISSINVFVSKEDKSARLSAWHDVKHAMDAFKPDIVHINSEFMVGYFGLTYSRHRNIASVYTFHTLWEDYVDGYIKFMPVYPAKKIAKEFIKFYLKRANILIAPTVNIANVIKSYGIERDAKILPTGIPQALNVKKLNVRPLFFNQLHTLLPRVQKKHILLYVGRVVKEKNLDFLFPVLAEVKKTFKDTVLVFVGGGPELDNLKEKAKKTGYARDIVFAGYRSREELAYFYSVTDVFVFPSKTETQGLVTLEAMMAGVPVVAIGERGTLDVMKGDNGGFMVKEDVNEFSQRVLELLKDKELYAEKSQEAKKWASQWSLDTLTEKLVTYYKEALAIRKKR